MFAVLLQRKRTQIPLSCLVGVRKNPPREGWVFVANPNMLAGFRRVRNKA